MIYLDYNATTPLLPIAKQAMVEAFDCLGNPSSIHAHGRASRKILENARSQLSAYFSVPARNVVFTSGATEANNMILKGFNGPVLVSAVDHDSALHVRKDATIIPVDDQGIVILEALDQLLKTTKKNALVCVIGVNNETGVIQPIDAILEICKKYQAHLHVDAAQAVGKVALDWQALPSFTISAHKFGGPKGCGALIVNGALHLDILIQGGGQERSLRAGTENIIGAVGMGAALTTEAFDLTKQAFLQSTLEENLLKACPDVQIFGKKAQRAVNTTLVAMPHVQSEVQLMHFDLHGISVSSGAACSSGKVKASHVLKAMGVDDTIAKCAIRISHGWETSESDIKECITVWESLLNTQSEKQKELRYA